MPGCIFSTDVDGNTILTVSNLRTSGTQPTSYGLYVIGLITGPAACSVSPGIPVCTTYQGTTQKESINSLGFEITSYLSTITAGVTFIATPAQNNVKASFAIDWTTAQPIPVAGSVTIILPYSNYQYYTLGLGVYKSMVVNTATISAIASYNSGGGPITISSQITVEVISIDTYIKILLGNTDIITATSTLSFVINELNMPPCLAPIQIKSIYSGDKNFCVSEQIDQLTYANSLPGDETTALNKPSASITSSGTGVMEENQTYQFQVYISGDLPRGAYFTLSIPLAVGVPSSGASALTVGCTNGCTGQYISLSWSTSTRLLTFNNVVPSTSSYINAPGPLVFTVKGFTNPASTAPAYFVFTSYAVLVDSTDITGTYMIDKITGMNIAAIQGNCTITYFYPTDKNYQIYGIAESWNVTMICDHAVPTTSGVRITFPQDWYVITSNMCQMTNQSSNYICTATNAQNQIVITSFALNAIAKKTSFSFRVNSIRNPTITGQSYNIKFEILSNSGGSVDIGNYSFSRTLITKGIIKSFTIIPQNQGVGQFPVYYDFQFQPSGEIYEDAYFTITFPNQITIKDENSIEKQCSYRIQGFTGTNINCKVIGNVITISSGFSLKATSNMLINLGMVPPTIKFSLPQFVNPRVMIPTDAFRLSVYSPTDQEIYTWNTKLVLTINGLVSTSITAGPSVLMTTPAVPQSVVLTRDSLQNGAVTNYNFIVTTTNYLIEGDIINLQLPAPVTFSESSICLGSSKNLRMNQTCFIYPNLTYLKMTLLLPLSYRQLQGGSIKKISSGEAFTFTVTKVKNPQSTKSTTDSVIYTVSTGGAMMEQLSTGLIVTNTLPGLIDKTWASVVPSSFKQSDISNFTLTFKPVNYQKAMVIIVKLPAQIDITADPLKCYGKQGTDYPTVNCTLNAKTKTITIPDAVQYQQGNPGVISIVFTSFVNPIDNIITDSFQLSTFTGQGNFILDTMTAGLQVNFFCKYPCATCPSTNANQCQSCYGGDKYQVFFQDKCIISCPTGWFNTTNNTCNQCSKICKTCSDFSTNCTSCNIGYNLMGNECKEIVYWPFPFIAASIFFFIIIFISEVKTKTESKFKEAFIAFLSLPEFVSWATYLVFHYYRKGFMGSFLFGAGAMTLYIILNFVHAIVHQRMMIPKSMPTYKALISNHRYNTQFVNIISYCFSFKFSILLVSYFFMNSKYKGDYSDLNWKQFYKFSLVFIMLPYPLMMVSCGYFLYTDGLFSYASWMAIEIIALSTLQACLMFVDSVSSLRTTRKTTTQEAHKLKNGIEDYESDDNIEKLRKKQKWREAAAEFGGEDQEDVGRLDSYANAINRNVVHEIDELNSHQSSNKKGILLNDETIRQINMLEELARQMKEEKDQLRLEREKIQREKQIMQDDQSNRQLIKLQTYYGLENEVELSESLNEQPARRDYLNLENQLPSTGKTVKRPYRDIEVEMTQAQISFQQSKRPYKDIEGEEMNEYETVHEEQASEDSIVLIAVEMPLAVSGKINYNYDINGSEIRYNKQLTAIAGGDSLLAITELADSQNFVDIKSAQYDQATNPPTRQGKSESYLNRSNAGYSESDNAMIKDDNQYYDIRSDAQMEIDSNRVQDDADEHYIHNEQAVFGIEDLKNLSKYGSEFQYLASKAVFELRSQLASVYDSELQFFAYEEPFNGDTQGGDNQLNGSVQNFIVQSNASIGYATDIERQQMASQQEFIEIETKESFWPQGIPNSIGSPSDFEQQQINSDQQQFENIASAGGQSELERRYLASPQEIQIGLGSFGQPSDFDRQQLTSEQLQFEITARVGQPSDFERQQLVSQKQFQNEIASNGQPSEFDRQNLTSQQLELNIDIYDNTGLIQQASDFERQQLSSQQQFNILPASAGSQSDQERQKDESQQYLRNNTASVGQPTDYERYQIGSQQYLRNDSASNGKPSDFERQKIGPAENFENEIVSNGQKSNFQKKQKLDTYGEEILSKDDASSLDFNSQQRPRILQQIRNDPELFMDESGHSESSEGIVDHNPFTSGAVVNNKGKIPDAQKQFIQKKKTTTIVYSDKSESSVEEMMGDTPSNYNILNGRFDGKSAGLKSMIQNAQGIQKDFNQGIKATSTVRAAQIPKIPNAPQNIKGVIRTNEQEERKFVNKLTRPPKELISLDSSIDGGWGNVNLPFGQNKVQEIGEELSADEHTSGGQAKKNKQKAIKTNKQFAESRNFAQKQNLTHNPTPSRAIDTKQVRKNNFV